MPDFTVNSLRVFALAIIFLMSGKWSHAALLYQDDFNSPPTSTNYTFEHWWGDSFGPDDPTSEMRYDKDNATASNGTLKLKAIRNPGPDDWGITRTFTSGHISTDGRFARSEFYAEIRARMPSGQGVWPAFWTLPQSHNDGQAEVDVVEYVSSEPIDITNAWHGNGVHDVESYWPGFNPTTGFHTYGAWVRDNRIEWFVDGVRRYVYANSAVPGNVSQYFMLSLQVGGDWAGASGNWNEQIFEVDYLRVYDAPPVPEPSMLLGLAGLLLLRRRR